jgi:HAMP domain-containing protein
MDRESRRVSLKWKISGSFTGILIILSLVAIVALYQLTRNTLRDQFEQRVLAIGTNLSDAAAGHIAAKNLLGLHALASKYALLDGVAYALIQDAKGEIVAHTLGNFPTELRPGPARAGWRQVQRREVTLRGKAIYETGIPVLEGHAGTVYVGFWRDVVEQDIRRALLPLVGIIALVPFIGALLSFLLAQWLVEPLVGLTKIADQVTMGNLETSVSGECVKSRDEIGDLARSLERMRSSLKAAMLRLGQETA